MFKALFSGKSVYANLMIFDNSKNKRIECVLIGACVLIRMNIYLCFSGRLCKTHRGMEPGVFYVVLHRHDGKCHKALF